MKNLKFIVAVALVGLGVIAWGDTTTTYRDSSGRIQGTEQWSKMVEYDHQACQNKPLITQILEMFY